MTVIVSISFCWVPVFCWVGFPGGLVVKNPSASAVDTGNMGSILVLGRSPGEKKATCSSILAWERPWTGAWWAIVHGVKRLGHDWVTEHANCDSRKRQSQEDLKTVQFLRKNVFLIEMCLNALPCLSPEAVPCRASVWMKRRPASSPLWAVWGQVNQETCKGFRGRFTTISSGSISEHHRQGTSSLNELLFTAILLRSIQMVVNMYFYFLKILSDSSYWGIIWLLLRPPFSSWDMQKVSGDTEVWLWKLNLTSWRLSLVNMGQVVPKSDSSRVLYHLTMSSESWR